MNGYIDALYQAALSEGTYRGMAAALEEMAYQERAMGQHDLANAHERSATNLRKAEQRARSQVESALTEAKHSYARLQYAARPDVEREAAG
jgi:vacuolar-type H+-ATPase subunit H